MRVIRFPTGSQPDAEGRAAGERLDALLGGEIAGTEGDSLRTLGADVRALAAPMAPEFESELQARVAEWSAPRRRAAPRRTLNERLAGLRRAVSASPGRSLALGGGGMAALAAILVVLTVSGWFGHGGGVNRGSDIAASENVPRSATERSPALGAARSTPAKGSSISPDALGPADRETSAPGSASSAGTASQTFNSSRGAAGRLQQVAASVVLATSQDGVQQASEAVARLSASDGGFVEQSRVQARTSGGPSEAQLRLQIPSSKLATAIAALGRIAPERAVNQESEDITSAYDSAKRRLGDAEAVRRALLRALAAATSEGRIDSLRERLTSNRTQISEYRSQVKGEAHRAATSELEVTITGGASASIHEGLTLRHGLRDAGHVLTAAAAVALIALAILLPLALAVFALEALRRAWRRRRRESALDL
jgi:hypothetical protein